MKSSASPSTSPRCRTEIIWRSLFLWLTLLVPGALLAEVNTNHLRDGLVAYWPLEVINSGVTPDVGFTNNMNVINNPTVSAGQFGNAFTFNGTSQYLTNGHSFDNAATGLPAYRGGVYTVAMWVKGAPQVNKYLYTESGSNAAPQVPLFLLQSGNATAANNSKLDVFIRTDGSTALINHVVSTSTVFDNTWHHIAWVDNRGQCRLYVDGVLDATTFAYTPGGTFTLYWSAIGALARVGAATSGFFAGQIDDVAVWERALSQAEVNQMRTNSLVPAAAQTPGLYGGPTSVVRNVGDWARLSVNTFGSRPYTSTYQWSKNGVPIEGASSRILFISNSELLTNTLADVYSVITTNEAGFNMSTNATATILTSDPAPNTTNGLVNYWPMDVIVDNGTFLMTPELHFGHSLVLSNFLDTNDFVLGVSGTYNGVSVNYSNSLFFYPTSPIRRYGMRTNGTPIYNNTNYTVAVWVKGNGVGQTDARVFSEGSLTANNPLFTLGTDNTGASSSATVFIRGDTTGNAAVTGKPSTRPVFDDSWHQMVWTDANGQGRLYVDGVLDETDYTYTRTLLTLNATVVGAVARGTGPVNPVIANIDEVATWNRVLSWTEIQQIFTNGVPIPQGIVAPSITSQPVDQTNGVYRADDVTFTVVAGGSLPFTFEWRKNGTAISGIANPTALTSTLSLTNVQNADSNTTYSVVISNASGSVTSSIARLYVVPWTAISNGQIFALDADLATEIDPFPGFDSVPFPLTAPNPSSLTLPSAVKLTISGLGSSTINTRHRLPSGRSVTNAPPNLTQASLYNDFIFASGTTGGGLKVKVERLAPNTHYGLTLWSYDPVSTGLRVSDWYETITGTPIAITNGYIAIDNTFPTSDYHFTLGGLLTSSDTGKLQIEGQWNAASVNGTPAADVSVFINAIRLVANPTGTTIAHSEVVGGNLRITVVGDYPGQPIFIHQRSSLVTGSWTDAGATLVETRGPAAVFEVPVGAGPIFYRAISYPTW